MKHSGRDHQRAEQDLAHLRALRPDADPVPTAGDGAAADVDAPARAGTPAGPVLRDHPGAGFGQPRYPESSEPSEFDPESVPRAPAGLSVPVAPDGPAGAVVGPAGPLAADLPVPPAMQYPAGPPLGPLPGQQRPPAPGLGGMPGGTTTLAPPRQVAALQPALAPPAVSGEWVTCPECGESQMIDPAQRRADDFCTTCDFPLFWARTAVVPMSTDETGASLRRLPGTVGRAATASVACPHCGEPNSPVAIICIRCSQPMLVAQPEPEPEPAPVYVPPPPEPEPEPGFPLWWVIGASAALVLITILVAWIALAV